MIKRISFLFCAVLMLVTMLAVPVFATEVQDDSSIKIIKQPENYYYKPDRSGYFEGSFTIEVSGDVSSYQWYVSKDGGSNWFILDSYNSNRSTFSFSANESDYALCAVRCVVTGMDGTVLVSKTAFVDFGRAVVLSFVTNTVNSVISWVGSIVNSLISTEGALYPLLPILAIGIAVTVVLLVTKIFKSFSWGL